MTVKSFVLAAAGYNSGPTPPPPLPPFVSSGCVLYYDPGNSGSYSGTGSTILDVSGNGNDGTISNATWNASYAGGAFVFTGSAGNNYIMTPNLYNNFVGVTWPTRLSIEVWLYGTANGSVLMEVGQNSISTGWRVNNIELGTVGPFFAPRGGFLNTSNAVFYNGPGSGTALNKWMHFVLVYNGTAPIVYYNGVAGGSANTGTRKVPWSQSPLLSGQTANYYGLACGAGSSQNSLATTSAMFTGRLGIMRVYNRDLTASEISTNYNGSKARYGL